MNDIKLEPFSPDDIDNLISWIDKPGAADLWAARTYPYPQSREKVLKHLEKTAKTPKELEIFKITTDGKTAGHVELDKFDELSEAVLITRLFVAPPYRDRGVAARAIKLLLEHCFNELRLNRVGITVIEHNKNALHLYEKLGFKREGFLRENTFLSGRRYGSYILSMLRSEYPASRKTAAWFHRTADGECSPP